MPQTIDLFNPARTPYLDTDLFGIGYGTPGQPFPTYKGTLANLFSYISKKTGGGQLTLVGNSNYTMLAPTVGPPATPGDFEVATSAALTSSPTWTLMPANSIAAGQRRRVVDLAGVIVPGTYQIAVSPAGSDKINGVNAVVWLISRFSYITLESDGVSNWTIVELGPSLVSSNNLADLSSVSTARGNLGLGTAAVHEITDFLLPSQNLNDVLNKATARSNLGLGALALLNAVVYSNLDPSIIATSDDIANATPNKLVPANVVLGSRTPVTIPFTQTGGTWDFSTFLNGLWNIPNGTPSSPSITLVPTNVKAGQQGFIIIKNQSTAGARTVQWPQPIFNLVPSTATSTSFPLNSANLFEYWAESTTLVRVRVTPSI